jgi:sugar phosphate isomerase/epimerase
MPSALGASVYGFYAGRERGTWPTLSTAVRRIRALDERLGVEVWATPRDEAPDPTTAEEQETASAACGAPFVSLHARGRCWVWDPAALRSEIDLAARIGAQTLVVHPETLGLAVPAASPDVPEIRRLLVHAHRRGVLIALENTVNSLCTLDRALDIAEDDPAFGICIDVGHAAQSHDAGRDPVRAYLERYRGRLVHLHLHDTMGLNDDHDVPGRGIVDWRGVFDTLASLHYVGPAVLEIVSGRGLSTGESYEALLQEALAFLPPLA